MTVRIVRALLAGVVVCSAVRAPAQESLYKQLFPNPTGQNGYEEIVMAGELAKSCEGLAADGTATLTDKRMLLSNPKAIRALDIVRAGLKKPIHSKRGPTDDLTFQAFAAIRSLARLMMAEQYVMLADGRVSAAIDGLRNGLTLGYAIQRDTIIGGLVGIAVDAIVIKTLETHVEQLSARDCDKLKKLALDWLNMPDPAIDALESERVLIRKRVEEQLGGANAQLGGQVIATLDSRLDAAIASLRRPYWERRDLPELTGATPAEQFVMTLDLERVFNQALTAFAREQAKVQILGVHAAIRAFKWENNQLPDTLEQLKLGRMGIDPFSGKPLIYKRTGENTYELTSEGLKPLPQ